MIEKTDVTGNSGAIFCYDAILCGDNCEIMAGIPESSVDLVVTSPPYNCGMDYETYQDSLPWSEYWEAVSRWVTACYRVVSDGGRLAVNLPWWMGSKPRRDVPFEFKRLAIDAGWTFLDKVTWVKGNEENVHTSGGFSGGGCGWGTYLSPSGPSIRCASEPILVFSKGGRGRGRVSGEGNGKCVEGDIEKSEWMAWTLDVWHVRGASDASHPAVFPSEIPKRLIKLYTWPGDVVLDPFNGAGTTTSTARELGRRFIGIDIDEKYCETARQRISQQLLPFSVSS